MDTREKETVIIFNEKDSTAEVYTFNRALQNKLNKLAETDNDCVLEKQDNMTMTFTIPKKWIKVSSSKKRNLSDEQRQELSERMKGLRQKSKIH